MLGGVRGEADRALAAADAAMATFDVEGAVAHLSAAMRALTAGGDRRAAAMVCVRLGDVMANGMGNLTAGRAWYTRARRLVADEPPCLEQGWVAVAPMGCDVDDPAVLLADAELALDRARRFGDVNLETKALADAGLAHVRAGRIADGMALLDEAMALACGPADDRDNACKSACSFFTACYFAVDFERAGSWADVLRRHGLIGLDPIAPVFISTHCDSVQAALLVELGRWSDADALLTKAANDFEAVTGARSWHPEIGLADLRIRQGRLAEAEALLLGKDHSIEALLPAAHLHDARGDHELAALAARRGLRAMGDDHLRAVGLLTVLIGAELAADRLDAASAACDELTARLADVAVPALHARAATARARVLAARGDPGEAAATVEAALEGLDPRQLPWLHTILLIDLARWHEAAGDQLHATRHAAAARAAMASLDVVAPPDAVALLDRLGRSSAQPVVATLALDGGWWTVTSAGTSVRLPPTKGLAHLAALVARPGAERHALDLVDAVEGTSAETGGIDRRTLGDAGPLLDVQARTAYRRRIEQLRVEIDDALEAGRLERAETMQTEIDQLVAELARSIGLGGRDRRAASVAERARLNVTRALRSAIAKLSTALPDAGAVLDRRVRTGTYCAYEPDESDPVRWIVQSRVNEPVAG